MAAIEPLIALKGMIMLRGCEGLGGLGTGVYGGNNQF